MGHNGSWIDSLIGPPEWISEPVFTLKCYAQQIKKKFKIQLLKTSGPNANPIGPPDYAILRDCYGKNYYKT